MPEGLSATEVGKEISEHREHTGAHTTPTHHRPTGHDQLVSILEALMLSIVALLAAWSGYSAAKWGTYSSLALAHASSTRTQASLAQTQGTQIRTLDSVSFNALEGAYVAHNKRLFAITLRRLRPGYLVAVRAWIRTHPLINPHAPPGPAYMPQYRIPQESRARVLTARADAYFSRGESSAGTSDKYVRLTVLLAAVLFLIGIGSRFPVTAARYGLNVVAGVLLVVAAVQLLALPGPPS